MITNDKFPHLPDLNWKNYVGEIVSKSNLAGKGTVRLYYDDRVKQFYVEWTIPDEDERFVYTSGSSEEALRVFAYAVNWMP